MTDVRNQTRSLKTKRFDAYDELTPSVGDEDTAEEYPFDSGFELFSAGLVIGYMTDDQELIQEAAEENEISSGPNEDSSYHPFVDLQQVMENNEDHAYTIELIDRLIATDLAKLSDDDEVSEDVWNLVVAHADVGVSIIRQQWKNDNEIEVGDRIGELRTFWADKLEEIAEELTETPNRGDQGRLESGD